MSSDPRMGIVIETGAVGNPSYDNLKKEKGITYDTIFRTTTISGTVAFHGPRGSVFFASRELLTVSNRELQTVLYNIASEDIVERLLDSRGKFLWGAVEHKPEAETIPNPQPKASMPEPPAHSRSMFQIYFVKLLKSLRLLEEKGESDADLVGQLHNGETE